jgi:hypothetical protein
VRLEGAKSGTVGGSVSGNCCFLTVVMKYLVPWGMGELIQYARAGKGGKEN